MKRIVLVFVLLFALALVSCISYQEPEKEIENEVPQQSIRYTNFSLGNVIQEGKQALFLNFVSDYTVTKMEIAGDLLDKNGDVIYSFDTAMSFGSPSQNPSPALQIESGLVYKVKTISFTKIKAYTADAIAQ